ncbi:MAG TPA: ribonuclease Z [archaeon]|nr:ribonuclease Z [archaeon]
MLSLVFLGTGAGIPSPARNLSAIWLGYEEASLLFDCGEWTQRQLQKSGISYMSIDHIFITHWHADHWAGIIGLMQTMNLEGRTKPLHIYGPTAEKMVADILDLDYWGPRFPIEAHDVPYRGAQLSEVLRSEKFSILSVPVAHTVPAVAYGFREYDKTNVDIALAESRYGLKQGPLVGQLKEKGSVVFKGKTITLEDVALRKPGLSAVYSGDTKFSKNLVALAMGADLLIHDSTFDEEKEGIGHAGAADAGKAAAAAGAKFLVLTHFSRRYQDVQPLVDAAKAVFPSTAAAADFLRVELKKGEPPKLLYRERKR